MVADLPEAVMASATALAVALIGGAITIRNARKTPHENLKSLLELLKDTDVQGSDRTVLTAAVHREIARIGLLNDARLQGFWAYQRTRYLSRMSPYTQRAALTALVLPAVTFLTTWAWPLYAEYPAPTGLGTADSFVFEDNDQHLDWAPELWNYVLEVSYASGWLQATSLVLVVAAVWLLTRTGITAARAGGLLRAWLIFGALAALSQAVTYFCFRLFSHIPPTTYRYFQDPNPPLPPCPGVYDPALVAGYAGGPTIPVCVKQHLLTGWDMLIYRWLQFNAQMIIFGVVVGWVVVVSILVRVAPAGRRALSRIHPLTWVRRRMCRFAWWPWP